MKLSNQKHWYAVYTRPRWEKKVDSLLSQKDLESYCPLNKVKKQWADRKKVVLEPLFTSYVFVRLSAAELTKARETEGVLNFVYSEGKPAIIKQHEIDAIKEFLTKYENVKLEQAFDFRPNDQIRITDGPLMLREGRVMEVRHKKVKIVIPSIGFNLVAEVEIDKIQRVSRLYY